MRKKIICGALLTAMCLSLVACGDSNNATTTTDTSVATEATKTGDTPTSESGSTEQTTGEETTNESSKVDADTLINAMKSAVTDHQNESMDMSISMKMTMKGSIQDASGNTKEVSMPMSLEGSGKFNPKSSSFKTTMTVDMGEENGGSQSTTSEQYQIDNGDGTMTSYYGDGNSWTKTTSAKDQAQSINMLNSFTSSAFDSTEVKEDDSTYTLIGKSTTSKMNSIGSLAKSDSADTGITITMIFDKSSLEFKSLTCVFDAFSSSGLSVDDAEITMVNNGYSTELVDVPVDIVNNAIDMSGTTETPSVTTNPDVAENGNATVTNDVSIEEDTTK